MRAKRVDANQPEIVAALRAIGCSVSDTSGAGEGFTDIVVGYRGINYLIEIKDGSKPPSKRILTKPQQDFHRDWRGQVAIAKNPEEAIKIVTTEDSNEH